MIFKRKLYDRIIHVLIYTTNEGIEPGATHWSGYMTERNLKIRREKMRTLIFSCGTYRHVVKKMRFY